MQKRREAEAAEHEATSKRREALEAEAQAEAEAEAEERARILEWRRRETAPLNEQLLVHHQQAREEVAEAQQEAQRARQGAAEAFAEAARQEHALLEAQLAAAASAAAAATARTAVQEADAARSDAATAAHVIEQLLEAIDPEAIELLEPGGLEAAELREAIELAQVHADSLPLVRGAIEVASARLAIEEEAHRREAEARAGATVRAERREVQLRAADPAAASPPQPPPAADDGRPRADTTAAADASTGGTSLPEIPNAYLCPISVEIMSDPVVTADGFTYERAAIMQVHGLVRVRP